METYSYHIFYFPFKWELPGEDLKTFSEQIDLTHVPINSFSHWDRVQYDPLAEVSYDKSDIAEREELFGELQYYFDFVHSVLYDQKDVARPLINHYERREPKGGNVEYHIVVKDKEYILKVDAINVNLYATGVGIMSFYLVNNLENQKDGYSIRDINQYGRRIMPPNSREFMHEYSMMSNSISIKGLYGNGARYMDSFDYCIHTKDSPTKRGLSTTWQPAIFIDSLIKDLSANMKATPVIDDRMMVNCWYGNNEYCDAIKSMTGNDKEFVMGDFWYKYVYVDEGNDDYCQNVEMKRELLKKSTYYRWQQYGTLYGVTRYSFVALTGEGSFISMHMRTIYSRMFELIIIQRASLLRFSAEVTKVSCLYPEANNSLALRIESLYREYIRFINQVYFKNVTAQEQGIELYDMLMSQFKSTERIKDLDGEISELHQYISLYFDHKRNKNGVWLSEMATIFLPVTILTAVFSMGVLKLEAGWIVQVILIISITLIVFKIIQKRRLNNGRDLY